MRCVYIIYSIDAYASYIECENWNAICHQSRSFADFKLSRWLCINKFSRWFKQVLYVKNLVKLSIMINTKNNGGV